MHLGLKFKSLNINIISYTVLNSVLIIAIDADVTVCNEITG